MTVRTFFGKARRKVLRLFLGRKFFACLDAPVLRIDAITSKLNNFRNEIHCDINNNINWHSDRLFNALVRTTAKATLTTVVISLVEHCNLNCRGCDHLAPLAEKTFLSLGEFEKDMTRLKELAMVGGVGTIKLMGGEPLLHPDILKFAGIARSLFKESRIEIVTNGILLASQHDSFWKELYQYNIAIVATKYPLNIDWRTIETKARAENVPFGYFLDTGIIQKDSYHLPFDISGIQDTAVSFMNCFHANNCRELYHGRMYTCTIIPHVNHFNKAFDSKLFECEADSIDIHRAKSMAEILEHLAKPVPFCRYCKVGARTFGHPWQQSKKERAEWTLE